MNESGLHWINKKGIPAHKVGRLWKFKATKMDQFVRKWQSSESAGEQKTEDGN